MIYKCHGKCVEGERYDHEYNLPRITFPQVINGETVQYFSEFTIEPELYAVEPKRWSQATMYRQIKK